MTADLETALDAALAARVRVVDSYSTQEIIAALAGAAKRWSVASSPERKRAADELSQRLGLDHDMLETGIGYTFGAITEETLRQWITREVHDPECMEPGFPHATTAGKRCVAAPSRLLGPPVVLHALAGNVPGLAVPAIAACLLVRSVGIIRDSQRQPVLTRAFLATLADHDSLLATMIVPFSWKAGDLERERHAVGKATRVELHGSDATVATIAARYPSRNVVVHGTRLSIGLVPAGSKFDSAFANGFAEDIALYEGKGCLTPHAIIVEGGPEQATCCAELLATALERLERRWPRTRQDIALESERRAFIDEAELAAAAGTGRSWRGVGDCWCIRLLDRTTKLALGPGLRCVSVLVSRNRAHTLDLLGRAASPLAGVGLAMPDDGAGHAETVAMLKAAGATLVCPPGSLQAPPIWWCQDGRQRLGGLLAQP